MPRELCPTNYYGIVEDNIYRSEVPKPINFEYIKSLNLKTFLYLSPETLTRQLKEFLISNKIEEVSKFD